MREWVHGMEGSIGEETGIERRTGQSIKVNEAATVARYSIRVEIGEDTDSNGPPGLD